MSNRLRQPKSKQTSKSSKENIVENNKTINRSKNTRKSTAKNSTPRSKTPKSRSKNTINAKTNTQSKSKFPKLLSSLTGLASGLSNKNQTQSNKGQSAHQNASNKRGIRRSKNKKDTYTSVKNRPTRMAFNQSSGASSRADFTEDKPRYHHLWFFAIILFALLILRAFHLQVVKADEYQARGKKFITSERTIPTYRGMILDRNDQPLAVSAPLMTVSFSPNAYAKAYYDAKQKMAKNPDNAKLQKKMKTRLDKMDLNRLAVAANIDVKKLKKVANITDDIDLLNDDAVKALIPTGAGSHYFPLLNKVSPEVADSVMSLKFVGVHQERFYQRYYPQPYSSTQLLGFMGENANAPETGYQGRAGLERQYQEELAGKDGKVLVFRDALRSAVKEIKQIEPDVAGKSIHLTIDSRLQFLLYQELEKVGRKQRAMWSSGMVVDVHTGEILAISTWPTYNANKLSEMKGNNQRNRPLIDGFEPGSVMKPFTVAAALESGKFNKRSMIDTSPGYIKVKGYTIRDHEDLGRIGFTGLLQHSSNVASTKIALSLPPSAISEEQRKFGFGKKTGLDFPGEQSGSVITPRESQTARRATVSYGYGLQVTLAQVAQAYAALGAGGILHPLTLIKSDSDEEKRPSQQVLSKENALAIVEMMESVTEEDGTAPAAAIDGYRVAGKTGTSRRVNPDGGYYKDRYRTTFAGVAPVSNPRLAVVILVEDPQENKYAGEVAAPVFHNVMKEALRLYNVPLDKPLMIEE